MLLILQFIFFLLIYYRTSKKFEYLHDKDQPVYIQYLSFVKMLSQYDACLTTNVDEYLANMCPEYALKQGPEYFNSLFQLFYQGSTQIYQGSDISKLQFQDLLSEMSVNPYVGQRTREKWLELCTGVSFTPNNPSTARICGCFTRVKSCGSRCNSHAIPLYQSSLGANVSSSQPFEPCFQNICQINGLNLSLNSSKIGDIFIQQLCPFCTSPGSCSCRIENFNISSYRSTVGKLVIDQSCHPDTSTITTSDGKDVTNIYSQLVTPPNDYVSGYLYKAFGFWILSLFLLVLILVVLVFSFKQASTNYQYRVEIPSSPLLVSELEKNGVRVV